MVRFFPTFPLSVLHPTLASIIQHLLDGLFQCSPGLPPIGSCMLLAVVRIDPNIVVSSDVNWFPGSGPSCPWFRR